MDQNLKRDVLHVFGMTCSSCEMRIENSLKKIAGIKEVKAEYSNAKVYITYNANEVGILKFIQAIEELGYEAKTSDDISDKVSKNKKNIKGVDKSGELKTEQLVGIGIVIIALYVIINNTIGFNFIPKVDQSMSYSLLFIVGLLTSLHCIAMCGGINLSQCVGYKEADDSSRLSKMKPSFLYNLGRVMSYTLIGGIVGALGSVVSFSGAAKGTVAIVAGIFMVIMGLNMLNLFPWLKKITPRMPKVFGNKIYNNNGKRGPLYIGLLNGLMPCGPLQTMQLYALGTGSFIAGATSMFLFSLGTVPLMFGFGALSTLLSKKFTKNMLKVSALLVMFLGFIMVTRGLSLSGATVSFGSSTAEKVAKTGKVAQFSDGVQNVRIDLESNYYAPIVVQKGIPVKFNIKAEKENINGCNNAIIIPKYNIQKTLEPGDNIIEFTPNEEGVISYSCWMGMLRSNILVVSDIAKVTGEDFQKAEEGVKGGGNVPPCCQ